MQPRTCPRRRPGPWRPGPLRRRPIAAAASRSGHVRRPPGTDTRSCAARRHAVPVRGGGAARGGRGRAGAAGRGVAARAGALGAARGRAPEACGHGGGRGGAGAAGARPVARGGGAGARGGGAGRGGAGPRGHVLVQVPEAGTRRRALVGRYWSWRPHPSAPRGLRPRPRPGAPAGARCALPARSARLPGFEGCPRTPRRAKQWPPAAPRTRGASLDPCRAPARRPAP